MRDSEVSGSKTNLRNHALIATSFIVKPLKRMIPKAALILLFGILVTPVLAQQAQVAADMDKETVQMLLQRINQLEAKVAQLEAPKQAPASQQNAQQEPPVAPEAETPEHPMGEGMDVSRTLLHIRGFSDVTFHGNDHLHDSPTCQAYTCFPSSFTLGQVNLFITSDLSERFKVLSEIVFEADQFNTFGVDVERILLQYSQSDYLNIAAGRFHTAIGYYNTAYHHSTWFQTATGRPFIFDFEDKGGPLPIHNVGVSLSGRIPSGGIGLHYVAEVGNGRAYNSYVPPTNPPSEAVQNYVDEDSHKAVNIALFARPDKVRGLQVGFSAYRDVLHPGTPASVLAPAPYSPARIGETILAAHAVFTRPTFEWLNEALLIRHTPQGGRVFNTPGGYTQISKRFGAYRPYFRYQYINAANDEPIYRFLPGAGQVQPGGCSTGICPSGIGLRAGPSFGLRYDPTEFVALKLQYDYTQLRQQQNMNGLAAQVGFTF